MSAEASRRLRRGLLSAVLVVASACGVIDTVVERESDDVCSTECEDEEDDGDEEDTGDTGDGADLPDEGETGDLDAGTLDDGTDSSTDTSTSDDDATTGGALGEDAGAPTDFGR